MGHRSGVIDQTLDPAQTLGQREDPQSRDESGRRVEIRVELEGHDPGAAAHLLPRHVDLGVGRQERVPNPLHGRAALQPLGDRQGVRVVLVHPERERLHAPLHEPGVEGRRIQADGFLREDHLLVPGRVVGHDDAAQTIRVAVHVLRRARQRERGAELERALEVGRGERVVDEDRGPDLFRHRRDRRDVQDLEHRVRRRLEPDERGPCFLDRAVLRRIREVDVAHAQAELLEDLREDPERAAVDVLLGEHEIPARQRREHGSDRRHPVPEDGRVLASLETRERHPEAGEIGIARTGVVVAPGLPRADLREGRCGINRRHDGTGLLVGFLADVDRAGLELHEGGAPDPGARAGSDRSSRR